MTRFLCRFSVKLDATDRDGTVRKGQGMEIKVGPENMKIYDEEIEAMLDAEMGMDGGGYGFDDDLDGGTGAVEVNKANVFRPAGGGVSR